MADDETTTPAEWRKRSEEARDSARSWELRGHLERARSFRAYAELCEGHAVVGELVDACHVDAMRALVAARERGLITSFEYDPVTCILRVRPRAYAEHVTITLDEPLAVEAL